MLNIVSVAGRLIELGFALGMDFMGHILPDIELIVALRFAVDFCPLFRLHLLQHLS